MVALRISSRLRWRVDTIPLIYHDVKVVRNLIIPPWFACHALSNRSYGSYSICIDRLHTFLDGALIGDILVLYIQTWLQHSPIQLSIEKHAALLYPLENVPNVFTNKSITEKIFIRMVNVINIWFSLRHIYIYAKLRIMRPQVIPAHDKEYWPCRLFMNMIATNKY